MMTRKIRVSAISYLNTAPFVYGLQHSDIIDNIDITFDYPSECARKLQQNESDIGIIPVAALLSLPMYEIISDYCIGAVGAVRTVALFSNSPLGKIERVYLDYQSRTSVNLAKILSKKFWKINPEWIPFTPSQDANGLEPHEGLVIIGDRVFNSEKHYTYCYDLAEEWFRFTGLPFVFAVWASVKTLEKYFVDSFNGALSLGLRNIPEAVDNFNLKYIDRSEAIKYLNSNLSFNLDDSKKKAIEMFLNQVKEVNL
ncbi:chorismate dehydratase [Tenuifilaceae bacterium CYCD]|nr:chorismate dehydratase [Tenuifilaceae bacterium CYCD]